jgi:catechol 2,3-dioxygenase-like lactoylglutathione lyase family enzyme
MGIRLFRLIVPVTDLELAERFYGSLLGVEGERISGGRLYFTVGDTIVACFDPRGDGDPFDAQPNGGHLYFAVDDLEAAHRRAEAAGAVDLGPIADRAWGERSFYLHDPFGNPLCFVDEQTLYTTASSGPRPRG